MEDMITDITLDHLPDLSDTSVSFQIPSSDPSADLLLADHTDGFDLLRDAAADDSFLPAVPSGHSRGQPLTLGELTPRTHPTPHPPLGSRSPTPTQVPSSSAKPSVIQPPLTLGHGSPQKRRKTPSRAKSIRRQLESPCVSEERLDQLRIEVATLGQPDAPPPPYIQAHGLQPEMNSPVQSTSPSRARARPRSNSPDGPPASEDRLNPIPEEENTETSSDQNVVTAPGDNFAVDATSIAALPSRPRSNRNPRTSAKATTLVHAGATSKRPVIPATRASKKTKNILSSGREAHQEPSSAVPQFTPPQSIAIDTEKELVPPACTSGDINFSSRDAQITQPSTAGMARRLVSYSQKLISSIGLSKPSPENSFTEAAKDAVSAADIAHIQTQPHALPPSPPRQFINHIASADIGPLFRLSEISPQKPPPNPPHSPVYTGTPQDGKWHAMSPMRPAKKRVSLDADPPQGRHRRKRGGVITADADSERGSSDEAVSQAHPRPNKKARHEDQSFSHSETCHSTQHLDPPKPTLPSARTKYRPKLNSCLQKGPTLDPFPYLTTSRQVHEAISRRKSKRGEAQPKAASVRAESTQSGFSASSRQRQHKGTRPGITIASSHAREYSGPASTADLPLIERKQNATLSVAQLTKPVGFTFRVDARLAARKEEGRLAESEPGKTHALHPVPDVKALRASHQAAFTFHREGVVPSVPVVPFSFCTEQRAKEREKFDEMVRRKEEEMQRLKEEQRRREAEEEEQAIKELRRKAIPKANEIPEWYADMPKRKGAAV